MKGISPQNQLYL